MAQDDAKVSIRPAYLEEWNEAMLLAWRVFLKFEADDYEQEGIDNFREFLTDDMLYHMFLGGGYQVRVAVVKDPEDPDYGKIVGMGSLRSGNLISLLFVHEDYHRLGIGRRLVESLAEFVRERKPKYLTLKVNAAPYALGFYEKLGFQARSEEIRRAGIIYTEMELRIHE